MEISCRRLVQIALRRDLAQQLLQRAPVKEILRTIFYRDLRKGNLQNLTWCFSFQGPAWLNTMFSLLGSLFVLLACNHWCFWVLSTFPFRILTTHCLRSFAGINFGVSCMHHGCLNCLSPSGLLYIQPLQRCWPLVSYIEGCPQKSTIWK